jgi:mRNA interferase HigB
MDINNLKAVRHFQAKYPDCRAPLNRWIEITRAAAWTKVIDVQNSFPSAEDIKGWVVFNIKGNSYRLITTIAYPNQELNIHEIMTHEQYDRWKP